MNLSQLCRQVSDKTALSDAPGSAELDFLERAANEGIRQVLLDTRCKVSNFTLSLISGTSEYDLATATGQDVLALVDYTNTDDNRQTFSVAPTTEVLQRRLLGTEGTALRFTLMGANLLIVSPTPSADQDVTLYGITQPAEISADDDLIDFLPQWAHKAVEWWMCIEASQKNKDYQGVSYYTDLYEKEAIKVRKRSRWLAGRRLAGSHVGYPDQPNRRSGVNSYDDGC